MKFHETPLQGAYLIELEKRGDDRGFFARFFCEREFAAAGLETRFVQINNSLTGAKGTLRGLHYQLPPCGRSEGRARDQGRALGRDRRSARRLADLSQMVRRRTERRQPLDDVRPARLRPRLRHADRQRRGALSRQRVLRARGERGVRWNDPAIAIEWPVAAGEAVGQGPQVAGSRLRSSISMESMRGLREDPADGREFVHRLLVRQCAASQAGAHVVAPLRAAAASYTDGTRAERVRGLARIAEIVDAAPFGSERFLDLVKGGGYDLLCHHAARVGDYRSPDFDIAGAVAENTANLRAVLDAWQGRARRASC